MAHIIKLAKQGVLERMATSRPGRPSKSASGLAVEHAEAEIEQLKVTLIGPYAMDAGVAGSD